MKKLVEIELPFTGFYETTHSWNIDRALEDGFNYNHETDEEQEVPDAVWSADVDHKAIEMEYCEAYVNAFADMFNLELSFEEMTSPKEYNFKTDRIFCKIPLTQIKKIRKQVEKHKKWPQYIKDNFTSYDGFWSNYDSDCKSEEWTKEDLDYNQYGVILKFWINEISTETTADNWREATIYIADDFEMCNWDSVVKAHEVIREYMKGEKVEEAIDNIKKAIDWIDNEYLGEHNMPTFAYEAVQELKRAAKTLEGAKND
jgi:hypothetical protein